MQLSATSAAVVVPMGTERQPSVATGGLLKSEQVRQCAHIKNQAHKSRRLAYKGAGEAVRALNLSGAYASQHDKFPLVLKQLAYKQAGEAVCAFDESGLASEQAGEAVHLL
eukprot:1157697-Pelagomonas_calceolata.AAC.7